MTELDRQLAAGRTRPGFMERLRQRVEEDKLILDRLEALEHAQQNRITEAVMAEIRRLAVHQHRYPAPNMAGFPVHQCLDCQEWRFECPCGLPASHMGPHRPKEAR